MENTDKAYKMNNVSNESIHNATGKTWPEWIAILDSGKLYEKPHKEIAHWLYEHHLKDGWWCQNVTVGYEKAKGLRKEHQKADGFSVSASKVMNVPLSKLYDAWGNESIRKEWLDEQLEVTSQTENKYFNARWGDGKSRITVGFYAKGEHKSQVALEHSKLEKVSDVEKTKAYWHKKLRALAFLLERE